MLKANVKKWRAADDCYGINSKEMNDRQEGQEGAEGAGGLSTIAVLRASEAASPIGSRRSSDGSNGPWLSTIYLNWTKGR